MGQFKKVMVTCAAITAFAGSAYISLSGLDLQVTKRVKESIAADVAYAQRAADKATGNAPVTEAVLPK
jgi:hypothetical protein